ncbi:MAG: EamA family transporter [Solirubrobacteraceae bacterium]|nr:EamA family transporter [Solirubrobacteraceae bacterium]
MDRRAALLFAALGVAWGIPYLLVKVAVEELSPAMLVLMRTSIAAAILLPLAARRGTLGGALRHWKVIAAYAVIEIVLPWLMIGNAELRLSSSTTALLIAATPLVGVALAFATRRNEALGRTGSLGLVLGFLGVAALVGLDIDTSDHIAVLQLGVVAIGYSVGPMILARWLANESGPAVVGLSFAVAAVAMLPILALSGGWPEAVPSAKVIGALAVLVLVCTVGAFLMLFELIGRVGPVRSTAVTYVNPAVAIVAGALFLGEAITPWTVVGFVLVLAGSVLLTRRPATQDEPELSPMLTGATTEFPALPELAEAATAGHSPLTRSRHGGVVGARRRTWRESGRRLGRPVVARRG